MTEGTYPTVLYSNKYSGEWQSLVGAGGLLFVGFSSFPGVNTPPGLISSCLHEVGRDVQLPLRHGLNHLQHTLQLPCNL